MNNQKYEEYCKEKYKNFFEKINCKNVKYKIINKKIIVKNNDNEMKTFYVNGFLLPNNLKLCGFELEINKYPIDILPDNLYINGSIRIYEKCNVKYFGKNSVLHGDLIANQSKLVSLKNIIIRKGKVSLLHSDVEDLGNNKIFDDDLCIAYSKIKKLPKGLLVKGCFELYQTQIEELPDNLIVYGDMNAASSKIRKFGKNNSVYGNSISIYNTPLEKIEDDVIFYSLFIGNTKVTELPKKIFDKNKLRNIYISNVFIKNIDEFFDYTSLYHNIYVLYSYGGTSFNIKNVIGINIEQLKKDMDLSSYEDHEKIIKNILLYNSVPVQKKLLLEEFDLISKSEIENYIKSRNKRKNLKNNFKDEQNLMKNKGIKINNNKLEFPLIYYCRTKKTMKFLKDNGYNFTQTEFKKITDSTIKRLYEYFLLMNNYNN